MSKCTIRISVPESIVEDVQLLASRENINHSSPQQADSTSEPLNAPISGADVILAAQVMVLKGSGVMPKNEL